MSEKHAATPEFLTTRQAAAMTGRSVRTIWRWMRRGILPSYRIHASSRPLFKPAEVIQALERMSSQEAALPDPPTKDGRQ